MLTQLYLSDQGAFSNYQPENRQTRLVTYRRTLPNALSRVLECTMLARQFDGNEPLLVLGDLPLRCRAPQTVLVHTPNLLRPARRNWTVGGLKYAIARALFRFNAPYAQAFIVQTVWMRDALASSYPAIADRIHVIAQPVPAWLLAAKLQTRTVRGNQHPKLRLIYPSAWYPHKNHRLLADIAAEGAGDWPVETLQLTIPQDKNPAPALNWVKCCGFLAPDAMIEAYQTVDGMLFLSTDESYGFPLVEAMVVGLPIVCPDLPYARVLCGDGALYFDPMSADSLHTAMLDLQTRLAEGWWPDWGQQLRHIPRDWASTARQMVNLACKRD